MTTGSIRIAMTSDVGLRRKNNQDTGFAQQGVFMVCDGMGGGKGGEQASQLAAQHFAQLAAMPHAPVRISTTPWHGPSTTFSIWETALAAWPAQPAPVWYCPKIMRIPPAPAALLCSVTPMIRTSRTRPMWSMSAIPAPTISVRWRMPMLPPRISFPCGTPLR